MDAGGSDRPARHAIQEIAQELGLPVIHLRLILLLGGEAQEGRSLHRPEGLDQDRVLGLGLVEDDVDPDRPGIEPVDRAQRVGEQFAVERRSLAEHGQGLVVEGDEHDPLVLVDPFRRLDEAQVVERPLGIARKGDAIVPAVAGGEQGDEDDPERGEHPQRADLPERSAQSLMPGRLSGLVGHLPPPKEG